MKTEITESDIEEIGNGNLTELYWELQLGIGLQYEYVSGDVKFHAPYPEMGKELWKAFKYELYELLCIRKSEVPREWLNDLVTGDIRNLVVGICSAITAKYEVTLGIALPLTALIIRKGILNYCSNPAKKPKKSVTEILTEKKSQFKR